MEIEKSELIYVKRKRNFKTIIMQLPLLFYGVVFCPNPKFQVQIFKDSNVSGKNWSFTLL